MATKQTKQCKRADCSNTFEKARNSDRLYCDEHPRGKVRTAAEEAVVVVAGEDPNDFVGTMRDVLGGIALPPVPDHIRAVNVEDMGFETPEHAVAMLSDVHVGAFVDPRVTGGIGGYDMDTALVRLLRWRDGVLRYTQMRQAVGRVPVLHLMALGDDMEGHGHMHGNQALQLEASIHEQFAWFTRVVPDIIVSLLERFERIHVYKVAGNHGRVTPKKKDNYDPDNFELMAWELIAERCGVAAGDRITFDISPAYWQLIDILGWSFLIMHGDTTNFHSRYVGLSATKDGMNALVGRTINYLCVAHHHQASYREEELEGEVITNGCVVGPTLYSVRMRKPAATRPSQEMLIVHPKRGITGRHRIVLADTDEIRNVRMINRN